MNSNGAAGIHTGLAMGARFPHLLWIGVGALGGGVVLLLLGGMGMYLATRRRAS
jgi:hypothetical protein